MKRSALWIVMLIPSVCHAWGVDGHRIIADIAWRNLDPKAQAAVQSIQGDKPITEVCTWADSIRKQPEYIFTDGCHGVTIPRSAEGYDVQRDCPDGRCAPAAIEKYSAILRNPKSDPAQRLDALKFVIHFVSDIHCPGHAAYKGDKSKLAGQVVFFGEKVALHKVWDASLIEHANKPWQRYAASLARAITPEQRQKWARATKAGDWSTESHRAFVDYAAVGPENCTLGEEYYQKNISVVNERLSMGGIRLATVLNGLLGEAAASQPAATMPG